MENGTTNLTTGAARVPTVLKRELDSEDCSCSICLRPYAMFGSDHSELQQRLARNIFGEKDPVKKEEIAAREWPIRLPCSHDFGSNCIEQWARQSPLWPTCPMCRTGFVDLSNRLIKADLYVGSSLLSRTQLLRNHQLDVNDDRAQRTLELLMDELRRITEE